MYVLSSTLYVHRTIIVYLEVEKHTNRLGNEKRVLLEQLTGTDGDRKKRVNKSINILKHKPIIQLIIH